MRTLLNRPSELGRIYNRAIELFLRGDYDGALDSFKRIYVVNFAFRDVEKILDDYYGGARAEWAAKYRDVFRASIVGRHSARFRRPRVVLKLAVHKLRRWLRLLTATRTRNRPGSDGPGLFALGKPVPVAPAPSHHLVAAKEFPPSDRTRTYPRD